ncbi:MAG: sugar ABC transporter substrate-binding protein [Lachnospiraceae bacterium]
MSLFKKMSILVLMICMVVNLEACGESSSDTESTSTSAEAQGGNDTSDVSDLKVGVVMKSYDEFQQLVMDGAKEAALELGIAEENITQVAPNNESDVMAQVTMVEDLISKDIDILVLAVNQEDSLLNVLDSAKEKGIQIVFADTQAESFEGAVTYIGTDNKSAAYEGGLIFAEELEENSNVVILRGKLGDVNHEARTEGLVEALEEQGHTVLEVQDANCETDKAASVMEDLLTKYPNQIDAVMVTSDSMAVGAAQAVKGTGVADSIKICGFDGFQSAISLIETDEITMIIGQKPYEMGYEAVKCGVEAVDGTTFDSYINPGIVMITSDNYKDYLK